MCALARARTKREGVHVCLRVVAHAHVCACVCVCESVFACVCVCVYVSKNKSMGVWVCGCVRCEYMRVCMRACVNEYICV